MLTTYHKKVTIIENSHHLTNSRSGPDIHHLSVQNIKRGGGLLKPCEIICTHRIKYRETVVICVESCV